MTEPSDISEDLSLIKIFQDQLDKTEIKSNAFLEDSIDYKYERDVHIEVDKYGKTHKHRHTRTLCLELNVVYQRDFTSFVA